MKYPDYETYEKLYYRFLLGDRSEEMLNLAGDIENKVFLDICCGDGRLSKKVMKRNLLKQVVMIDSEKDMIPQEFIEGGCRLLITTVEKAFLEMRKTNNIIDVAICQQGINYWLTEAKAWSLSLLMPEGGIFIFNTFNKKPSEIPSVKQYSLFLPFELKERHYTEISWSVRDDWFDIYHVQICQGEEPHFTKFKWMNEEYIRTSLNKFFEIELITDNKTSIYKCIKK